jgi:STE24 endopeptidase
VNSPGWAGLVACVLLAAVVALLVVVTPHGLLPSARNWPGARYAPAAGDFSADELARGRALRLALLPSRLAGGVLSLGGVLALGFSPLGAHLVRAAGAPFGGGWPARAVAGAVVLVLLFTALRLPFTAAGERVLRRTGLSVRSWAVWWTDLAKGTVLSVLLLVVVALAGYGLARALPAWWWAPATAGVALLVVLFTFVLPLVVEPLFNQFEPMPDTPLRGTLLALAASAGVRVTEVLVADASRRTTALNAYVSGIGATRRVVVFDTTLRRAEPREIEMVVAHELGHVRHRDVAVLTGVGALAAALAVPPLYLLLRVPGYGSLIGVPGGHAAGDPRSLPAVLALVGCFAMLAGPLLNAVSRRVEAHADLHALELTEDPAAFAAMQRRLALTNQADLTPPKLAVLLRASHPPTAVRIELARAWARHTGRPEPGPLLAHE